MITGFVKYKKNLTFVIFSSILGMSCQQIIANNNCDIIEVKKDQIENQEISKITTIKQDELTSNLKTLQRTVLKSIAETFWMYLKEKKEQEKPRETKPKSGIEIESISLNELGKISSQLLIDELIENPNSSIRQKLIELWVPTIVAFTTTKLALKEKKYLQEKWQDLIIGLAGGLFFKLLMVKCFFKPGSAKWHGANVAAFAGSFFDKKTKQFSLWKGFEQVPLDQLMSFIQASKMPFDALNKRTRKKALGKTSQVLAKPLVQFILNAIHNKVHADK